MSYIHTSMRGLAKSLLIYYIYDFEHIHCTILCHLYIYIYLRVFVCLFVVNGKTTARIDAKRSGITKNDTESVLRGLKPPVLVFLGRYRDISGFSFTTDCHFYLYPFHFRLFPRRLTQRFHKNGVDRAPHGY